MTFGGLERALGMLLLDAAFCERFFFHPSSAPWEAGLPLSPIEVDALSRLSRAAITPFRESLEPRLRRRCETHPAVPGDAAVPRRREDEA
jgi:hypothetical protein